MSKQISRIQRLVVMVTSVIIVVSITSYPSPSAYATPGPLDRLRAKIEEGKKKIKEGQEAIEALKDEVVAVKMAIENVKREGQKFEAHCKKFQDDAGPRDLIGRSFPHFAYIAVMWVGLLLLLFRKEDYDRSVPGFAWRFAVAFLPAVFLGFYFEMLRSSNINEFMMAIKEVPDLEKVGEVTKIVGLDVSEATKTAKEVATGTNEFLYYCQYILPGLAGVVWVAGMFSQRRWLHKLGDVRLAYHMKELKHFLRHRALPPHVLAPVAAGTATPGAPTAPATPSQPTAAPAAPAVGGSPQAAQPATASPAPGRAPFVRPKTTVTRYCPGCMAYVEVQPNGNFCADCGSELRKEAAAPTAAPAAPAAPAAAPARHQPPSLYEIWWRNS